MKQTLRPRLRSRSNSMGAPSDRSPTISKKKKQPRGNIALTSLLFCLMSTIMILNVYTLQNARALSNSSLRGAGTSSNSAASVFHGDEIGRQTKRSPLQCVSVDVASKCPSTTPKFVTFAFTHIDRWSHLKLIKGFRLMYSSLTLAHGCPPLIYIYTNSEKLTEILSGSEGRPFTTTFGSPTNVVTVNKPVESIQIHGYEDPWIGLSRHKLDIIQDHLLGGKTEKVIWIDIDTLVFEGKFASRLFPFMFLMPITLPLPLLLLLLLLSLLYYR